MDTETYGQKGPVRGAESAASAVGQNRLVWGLVGALGTLTGCTKTNPINMLRFMALYACTYVCLYMVLWPERAAITPQPYSASGLSPYCLELCFVLTCVSFLESVMPYHGIHAHHRLRVVIQNHHPDPGEHKNAPGRRGWSPVFSYSERVVMDMGHFGGRAGP